MKRIFALLAVMALMVATTVMPAMAQPVVTGGLVNVTITDVLDVQGNQVQVAVPIGIAANVCPTVNAAVLAQQLRQTGEAACDATSATTANNRAFQNVTT